MFPVPVHVALTRDMVAIFASDAHSAERPQVFRHNFTAAPPAEFWVNSANEPNQPSDRRKSRGFPARPVLGGRFVRGAITNSVH